MNQMAKNINSHQIAILKITIENNKITADLNDGRIVSIPIAWFPRLVQASAHHLQNFTLGLWSSLA